MIIEGETRRGVPRWWTRWIGRRVQAVAAANPGFHRLVVEARPAPAYDTGHFVDPEVEPAIRRLLSTCMRLDDPVIDDDPYVLL